MLTEKFLNAVDASLLLFLLLMFHYYTIISKYAIFILA